MVRRARQFLEEFGHQWIDPRRTTDSYDFAARQVIEIIRVFVQAELLGTKCPVLLLDEPTAGLLQDETEFLFQMLRSARERSGVIFVGHRLRELLDESDRIMVLKDGVMVGSRPSCEFTEPTLHALMVGRARSTHVYREDRQRSPEAAAPLLEVRGLSEPPFFRNVSFEVHAGEILGVGGVLASGKAELGRAIFGLSSDASGEIRVRGKPLGKAAIRSALKQKMGYVAADRANEGVMLSLPLSWNVSLARIASAPGAAGNILSLKLERQDAASYVDLLKIKASGVKVPLHSLSGGNQQKVVLARWLAFGSDILVLDNPTRGVDAGAKEDIYDILRDLADQGKAILLITDDLLELIGISNRIVVMKGGAVVQVMDTPPDRKPDEVEVVAQMV